MDIKQRNNIRKRKISGKTFAIVIINIIVIAGALIGAYFVFYTPEKRLERGLSKAEKAIDGKEYEDALVQYKNAIEIDKDSVVARLGLLKVYDSMNRKDELKEEFDEDIRFVKTLDDEKYDENTDKIINIYLYADKVYIEDIVKRITIYEEAYEKNSGNELIKNKLIENYLSQAYDYSLLGDMVNEVESYNRILELDNNQEARNNRKKIISDKIDELIAKELFDEAEKIVLQYKDIVDDVDFETYSIDISEKKNIHDAKYNLLSTVYEYMSKQDYESMMTIDGTVEANFVGLHIDGSFVYTPDEGEVTNYTGKAAAIFIFKEEAYYFYYGDFVDGKCQGNGVMFLMTDEKNKSYYIYDGAWVDNMPNGRGKVMAVHEYDADSKVFLTREESGNFTNGMQDGKMDGKVILNDTETYTGSWKSKMGVPKDVSSKYSEYPFVVPEGKVLYAVFLNSDKSAAWGSWISRNGHLGVMPFVN